MTTAIAGSTWPISDDSCYQQHVSDPMSITTALRRPRRRQVRHGAGHALLPRRGPGALVRRDARALRRRRDPVRLLLPRVLHRRHVLDPAAGGPAALGELGWELECAGALGSLRVGAPLVCPRASPLPGRAACLAKKREALQGPGSDKLC